MNSLFVSHGGGPLPLLGDKAHSEMVTCLKTIAMKLPKPSAIVLISAHWEEDVPTVTSGAYPKLIYDYYGFAPESYTIEYPCPGSPSLALKIQSALKKDGMKTLLDPNRGFDHGLFVPLKIMYPEADIPCVQLSLMRSLDGRAHIQMGKALRHLEDESVLIVGSGFSFHNLREFFSAGTNESQQMNKLFEAWLSDTCANREHAESETAQRLIDWLEAPGARFCHPRAEHLLPLHVCYGAAQAACTERFELQIMGKQASMYYWDGAGKL